MKRLVSDKNEERLVLYIVVDGRLSKSQRIPQAVHAAVELQKLAEWKAGNHLETYRRWADSDKTVVCLVARADVLEDLAGRAAAAEFFDEVGCHGRIRTAVALPPVARGRLDGVLDVLRGLRLA